MLPNVTVIVPTYNIVEGGYLSDFDLLVNLMEKQTYPEVQLLIMDNSSTDDTLDMLKDYKNNGFLEFYSAPDNGKYDAINKGIMRANGKYIGILSCDDFFHDITAIADIVNIMETEEADLCCYPTYCIQPDFTVFQFVPSLLNTFQVMPCPHQGMFFKKSSIEQLGYFDTKFNIMADYDMVLRMILNRMVPVYYDGTCVTYHSPERAMNYTIQVEAECKHLFYKNYKQFYNMTDEVLDRLVKVSEIPRPLLEKLEKFFPPEDKELFYQKYNQMHDAREEGLMLQKQEERMQRGYNSKG